MTSVEGVHTLVGHSRLGLAVTLRLSGTGQHNVFEKTKPLFSNHIWTALLDSSRNREASIDSVRRFKDSGGNKIAEPCYQAHSQPLYIERTNSNTTMVTRQPVNTPGSKT